MSLFIVGLMSGTSLDGIDAVLLEVEGSGKETEFNILAASELPFDRFIGRRCLSLPGFCRIQLKVSTFILPLNEEFLVDNF